jgi:DNA polymerase-3 subunit delta
MANKNQELIDNLKKENIKPAYLIHGTEPYFIDKLTQKIIDITIPDYEKSFNEVILYGKDLTTGDVIRYARQFPMMGDKQLVVIKEAHQIADIGNKENQTLLENYMASPQPSTVLVMSFGKAQDERKTWVKSFQKKGEIHNFKKMYDNEVPDFIIEYCKASNIKISPKAVQLLDEHIGNNLQTLIKEIDKILVNIKPGEAIDAGVIEEFVGISKDYNVFELQKALTDRNVFKSVQIAEYFGANSKDHPIQPTIIILYNFFSKILLFHGSKDKSDKALASSLGVNPYFLKDYKKAAHAYPVGQLIKIIHTLKTIDKKSKGIDAGSATESDLYKELIFDILH